MSTIIKRYRRASLRKETPKPQMDKICHTVAKYYGMESSELMERTRKREVLEPRQIAMFFMAQINNLTYKAIGEYFLGYNHATIMHSISKVLDLTETDNQYKSDVEQIQKLIAA